MSVKFRATFDNKFTTPTQAAWRGQIKNDDRALGALSNHLSAFVSCFSGLFKTKTNDGAEYAQLYVNGLLTQVARKNRERINEHLDAGEYENVQQFLSSSPWEESPVYERIASRANARLGDRPDTCLIIDESAHSKKGRASVGVARQYNGRLGKQDNCQVGVYSALNCGTHTAIIGSKLYLPEEWVQDRERALKAGVPEHEIKERSKLDLARELIDQALEQKVQFACIVLDAFYGRDSHLLEFLDERNLTYCAEVPANTNVFTERPTVKTRPDKIKEHTRRVGELAAQAAGDAKRPATKVSLREGENGLLQAQAWAQRIWVWPAHQAQPKEQWLLIRKMSEGELKTSLSNAALTTSVQRLAKWQAGRFHVERAFQDAKSHLGMGQYQSRGWRAWHHHMSLVAMAQLFVMEERMMQASTELSLLSTRDVVELLDYCLTKPRTAAQVMSRLRTRHQQRQRNAESARRRKRKELGLHKSRKRAL